MGKPEWRREKIRKGKKKEKKITEKETTKKTKNQKKEKKIIKETYRNDKTARALVDCFDLFKNKTRHRNFIAESPDRPDTIIEIKQK